MGVSAKLQTTFSVPLVAVIVGLAYLFGTKEDVWYRATTSITAIVEVLRMPKHRVESFLQSYDMFEQERFVGTEDEIEMVTNYYGVLNHLCAIGNFEKMYLPPLLDLSKDTYGNQLQYEREMADKLEVKPKQKVLDIGCGRGRVAHHVARRTGAHVTGINVDEVQIGLAKDYAAQTGMQDQLEFKVHNYNDPLPFPDAHFDALYYVQVLSYSTDLNKFFEEAFRVVKPGGKVVFEDYVMGNNYEEGNKRHEELVRLYKPVLGGVETVMPKVFKAAVEHAGFEILSHEDPSINGHQFPLLEAEKDFWVPLEHLVGFLSRFGLVPQHFLTLMERMNRGVDAVIEADKLGIVSMGYVTVARKPF